MLHGEKTVTVKYRGENADTGYYYSQMHDSSACIVRDGELLFAWRKSASAG